MAVGRRGAHDLAPADLLAAIAPREVRLDASNTHVAFEATWFGAVPVRGRFEEMHGVLYLPDGDPARASVAVEIDAASVRTGIALRDRHLCGPTFLDAARHPVIVFRGASPLCWSSHFELPGSLTLRGETGTEQLDVVVNAEPGSFGRVPGDITASTVIDRRRYGVGRRRGLGRLSPLLLAIGATVRLSIGVRLL